MLGWAHFQARGALRELPAQLGADIQREANGFTYSQTLGGRVVYTLHAKRATQRTGGTAQLEDAGLVLYGNGDGRADRIYGRNFLYNQSAGIVTSRGIGALLAPQTRGELKRCVSGGSIFVTDNQARSSPIRAIGSVVPTIRCRLAAVGPEPMARVARRRATHRAKRNFRPRSPHQRSS